MEYGVLPRKDFDRRRQLCRFYLIDTWLTYARVENGPKVRS